MRPSRRFIALCSSVLIALLCGPTAASAVDDPVGGLVAAATAPVAPVTKAGDDGVPRVTPPGPSDAPRSSGSTRPQAAAAMKGGVDERDARGDHGLGSPAVAKRDGGVQDGPRVVAAAEPVAIASAVRAPGTAPPVIAAAVRRPSPRPAGRGTDLAAEHPWAARLRDDRRRADLPLTEPGVQRSALATTRRSPVIATRSFGGTRAPVAAPSAAVATSTGVAVATASAPPPAAVSAVLLAVFGLLAAAFSILIAPPARSRPVPFISLLERPG
jgi:hypothetical protein